VSDSDPPYKIDDGESPADGNRYSPDADALQKQVANGVEQHHRHQEGDSEADEPAIRRGTGQHNGADFLRDRAEGVTRLDDRRLLRLHRRFVLLVHEFCQADSLFLKSACNATAKAVP